jgi:RHS repeat-associated protein
MTSHTLSTGGIDSQLRATFLYDGAGNRVQQIDYTGSTPVTTTYTNDIVGLAQVLVAADGATAVYNLWGLRLLAQDDGETVRLPLTDGLGSVRVEMVGGAIESATAYDPYGNLLAHTGTSGTTYGYTGEQHDEATGLLYLRARYYNPALRSFMGKDPWFGSPLWPQSMNGWSYVDNNPAGFRDPTGFIRERGEIENTVKWRALAWVWSRGPNDWLSQAVEFEAVRDVYETIGGRLAGGVFEFSTVRRLYSATWFESMRQLDKLCIYDELEAAHISFIVLGAISRGVGDRGTAYARFPGYIENPHQSDPKERRGADTTQHFLFHAFLAFEMRYSLDFAPQTAEQLRTGLNDSGFWHPAMKAKVNAVRQKYRESGNPSFHYWGSKDQHAYSFAVTAGDMYEVISTYDSHESQAEGGLCHQAGGIYYRLRHRHGCALLAFTDSLDNFLYLMANPDHAYPSGIQDPGVYDRDLRANREGADFGIRAFHNPRTWP